jgi:hypothetical protein
MATELIDLVLDTGDIVRIECTVKHADALHDAIDAAMKRRDQLSPHMFDGCSATLNGLLMSRINMARVVGML